MSVFLKYIRDISTAYESNIATEHSYRPALQSMLKGFTPGIEVVNEPNRIQCGAPDFVILRDSIPIGYIECKDIDKSLDDAQKSPQLQRYLNSLPNLILTDYLEFRWFLKGEKKQSARLGSISNGIIKRDGQGIEAVSRILETFIESDVPFIGTTGELALRMAKTAQLIRDAIRTAMSMEDHGGTLRHQMEAFKSTLLHDITPDKFSDMYAQTICYGLFMARIYHTSGRFTRQKAPYLLPKSNPFLLRMFNHIAGIELDDRIAWAVDNLAEIFNRADMSEILSEFGKRKSGKDPILHFYEDFLAVYDPRLRKSRGVYYTPEAVVSYIVRSVDKVLKSDFNLTDGLVDARKIQTTNHEGKPEEVHKVQILDPAVGTGSFLHGIIDHIRESFTGNEGLWKGYIDNDLLPRLYGFELLMAPYTIAHLKIGMLLKESNYEFPEDKRLKIYLTNSLEEINRQISQTLTFGFSDWLIRESIEAGDIKADAPVMVVLGNPPYSGHSENKGKWIKDLLRPYFKVDGRPLGERNPKWLNDDYVKFIRFAQWRIEQTGYGVLAFISNHSYLDNPTFRGMRQNLMNSFDKIFLLDLHGNSKRKEKCPDGSKDENVFDIQQGVGIGIFIKEDIPSTERKRDAKVYHADLWGLRQDKYDWLMSNDIESTTWEEIQHEFPFYLFSSKDTRYLQEYNHGWKINDIFPINSVGIVTARDKLTIKPTCEEVWKTVNEFIKCSPEEARELYELGNDVRDWKVEWAQKDLKTSGLLRKNIAAFLYRPFDTMYTYYTGKSRGFHCMPRNNVMRHMLAGDNLGLITTRQTRDIWDVYTTKHISGHKSCAAYDINTLFPLYLYPENEPRRPNLSVKYLQELSAVIGFEPTPEQVFYYIYAVFHSPVYRSRYAEFLKMDFPRVPMPPTAELFRELNPMGEELVGYHLMERTGSNLPNYPVDGDDIVEQIRYNDGKVWINKKQYIEGVPTDVWEFHIGGYQVCDKWLKDRKGRTLSYDDIKHYRRIVAALSETIRLMVDIGDITRKHFGW